MRKSARELISFSSEPMFFTYSRYYSNSPAPRDLSSPPSVARTWLVGKCAKTRIESMANAHSRLDKRTSTTFESCESEASASADYGDRIQDGGKIGEDMPFRKVCHWRDSAILARGFTTAKNTQVKIVRRLICKCSPGMKQNPQDLRLGLAFLRSCCA
jgi:hypothetical protein